MLIIRTILAATALFTARDAHAQLDAGKITATDCTELGLFCNPATDSFRKIGDQLLGIINAFLVLTATIAFGALVYYGALYIMSRGEEDNARKAKVGVLYTFIGLIIIGIAGWLVNAILNLPPPS